MIPGSFLLSSLVEVMISSVSVWMKRWETWTQQQCVRVLCWCFPKRKSCTLQKTHFEAFHIALGPGLRTCSVKHSTDSYLIPVVGFQSPLQDTWAGAVLWRAATTEEKFNLNTGQNWTVNRETSRRFSWGGSNYCHSAQCKKNSKSILGGLGWLKNCSWLSTPAWEHLRQNASWDKFLCLSKEHSNPILNIY